jgi:hypothetical protein
MMVVQALRAKGVRYPATAQKNAFKTWYSYALKQGEIKKTTPKEIKDHGRYLSEMKEAGPGGRTYL